MPTLREIIDSQPELEGLDYSAIAAWLNAAPLIPNPITVAPQIPIDPDVGMMSLLIPAAEFGAVVAVTQQLSMGRELARALEQPSFPRTAQHLMTMLEGDGVTGISPATKTTLDEYLAQTIADPNYQAQIPGAARREEWDLPVVTAEAVQGAFA